jgi:hypothetical protein
MTIKVNSEDKRIKVVECLLTSIAPYLPVYMAGAITVIPVACTISELRTIGVNSGLARDNRLYNYMCGSGGHFLQVTEGLLTDLVRVCPLDDCSAYERYEAIANEAMLKHIATWSRGVTTSNQSQTSSQYAL